MAKILAFAGSNNSQSINLQTLKCTLSFLNEHEVKHIDPNKFDIPMFGLDLERESGIPEAVKTFRELFHATDAFLIATPEHNSSVPAYLKNILDWMSRADDQSIFLDKPVFLLSTSPGGRAGLSVREHLAATIPYRGASKVEHFGIGPFKEKFDSETQTFKDQELAQTLSEKVKNFFNS